MGNYQRVSGWWWSLPLWKYEFVNWDDYSQLNGIYPLVICYITMERSTMLSVGKSTILKWSCNQWLCNSNYQRLNLKTTPRRSDDCRHTSVDNNQFDSSNGGGATGKVKQWHPRSKAKSPRHASLLCPSSSRQSPVIAPRTVSMGVFLGVWEEMLRNAKVINSLPLKWLTQSVSFVVCKINVCKQ